MTPGMPEALLGWMAATATAGHARWDLVVAPQPGRLVWPLLFALGAGLLVGRGRRPLPLAERMRRLDLDARLPETLAGRGDQTGSGPLPGGPGVLLGPLGADAAALLTRLARRLAPGLVAGPALARELRLAFRGRSVGGHAGVKVACALALGLLGPLAWALDGFDSPPWLWLLAAGLGFLAPDWELRRRLRMRQERLVAALPPICDQLSVALSAGLSLEQTLLAVTDGSVGDLADELRWVLALVQGGATLVDALDEMEARNGLAEVSGLVAALRAAYRDGSRAGALVAAHADALRAAERARLVEHGARAMTRMVLPVGLFLLPVMVVVLVVPAVVQFAGLGGGS